MRLPTRDGRALLAATSPWSAFPTASSVSRQPSQQLTTVLDGTGVAHQSCCSGMAQEKLVGSTTLRSCSRLLALQHLEVSGRDASCRCLLSTSKVSRMAASQWKWVSSCSSSCPGTQSRSLEEKQEEPFDSEWLLWRQAGRADEEAGCQSETWGCLLSYTSASLKAIGAALPLAAGLASQISALVALSGRWPGALSPP